MNNQELIELAKMSVDNFHHRRTVEWQLLLAYWGSLGVIVAGVVSSHVSLSHCMLIALCCALVALFIVAVLFCIMPIQRANARDKEFFLYYARRVEGLVTEKDRPGSKKVGVNLWWTTGQIVSSALITIIAIILVVSRGPSTMSDKPSNVSEQPSTKASTNSSISR